MSRIFMPSSNVLPRISSSQTATTVLYDLCNLIYILKKLKIIEVRPFGRLLFRNLGICPLRF